MFKEPTPEKSPAQIKELQKFTPEDLEWFRNLEGNDGWVATDFKFCKNPQYFVVYGENNEKLGGVGVYDTEDDQNITHTVVASEFRGQGLASKFKLEIMEELGLDYFIGTVDLDNIASVKSIEKMPGIRRVSDEAYEKEFHKAKFRYDRPEND
ncbi:GNAT family N-acetyltransferase [Candidatus Falkowbacteria bacterium]|jgi:predicted acetyltransferase|nr:GNAT family N-acetyltransferase [Candidatus Falkowbacteria bacterium]MBT5503250.1 GNAT family N-acetyltransferase [Candidatus Falkowbacteria bacterium]MBT6574249.1 GNAT family N-acetyltransferase [Candidatus Falkowbacteria bacterium]MBT7348153.1 GNAT family N-acetyltransferase [Candidatus Falkowbacteria bacterium]MBT7500786.1 GNAT family N-acetyltransferase [Candidatus Falkowbacteria bacterium]